jgi:hypothetical protein
MVEVVEGTYPKMTQADLEGKVQVQLFTQIPKSPSPVRRIGDE